MKSIVFVETTMYIQFDVAVICFKTMQPDVEQCHASIEKNTRTESVCIIRRLKDMLPPASGDCGDQIDL